MVHAAKALAVNMSSPEKANDWRAKNNLVSLHRSLFTRPFFFTEKKGKYLSLLVIDIVVLENTLTSQNRETSHVTRVVFSRKKSKKKTLRGGVKFKSAGFLAKQQKTSEAARF